MQIAKEYPNKKILYLAFNKKVANEISIKPRLKYYNLKTKQKREVYVILCLYKEE